MMRKFIDFLQVYLVMTLLTSLVASQRVRGRTKTSTQHIPTTITTTVKVDEDVFGGFGFEDPMKPSSGLGFEPVVPKTTEPTCADRSSCQATGNTIPRNPNDVIHRNCFCDDLCQTYDDCCDDYIRHLPTSVETIHLQPEVISCQPLGVAFKDKGDLDKRITPSWKFLLVNRCPTDYNEAFIRSKCELGNNPDSETFYRLPVNGRTSKVLYRNYYCAICNGNPDVLFWSGHLDVCEDDADLDTRSSNRTIHVVRNNSDCDLVLDFPPGFRPRPCKKVTRKCSDHWTDTRKARECQDRAQSTSYQYHETSGKVFRSKACAACNFVNDTGISCKDPVVPHSESPPFGFPPYSVLIDMNSKILVLESGGAIQMKTQVELRECDMGFVYDPFADVCRPIYCRKDYVLTDSGCVPSSDPETDKDERTEIMKYKPRQNRTDVATDPGSKLNCDQTIRLNQSEYKLFDNQSVYVHHLNDLYERDQYVPVHPNIFICSPFSSRQYNATVYEQVVMFKYDQTQGFLSFVGVIISLMSLAILFVVYMVFPVLRNTPGKCVLCLISSLFVGQFCYLFVGFDSPVCFYHAALMHLGYLASFFWTNVLAYDICRVFMSTTTTTLTDTSSRSKRFLYFSIYAWLSPVAIVAICVTLDVLKLDESFRPHYSEVVCWITSQTALLVFFVVPVGVILLVNIVFFVIAIHCICTASRMAEAASPKGHTKCQLIVHIKLSFIMGLTWVFGLLASLSDWVVLWYLFIVLNSLQGAFLALVFVCTKRVFRQMRVRWSTTSRSSSSEPSGGKKRISSSVNETTVLKDKSRVVSRETCM